MVAISHIEPISWREDLSRFLEIDSTTNTKAIEVSLDAAQAVRPNKHTVLIHTKKLGNVVDAAIDYLQLTLKKGFAEVIYPEWGDTVSDMFGVLQCLPGDPSGRLDDSRWPIRGNFMAEFKEDALLLAPVPCNVLILGESGTGKEGFARLIHTASMKTGHFVAASLPAIPDTMFEASLFGVMHGAATGVSPHVGFVDQAKDGTLFLDEIADLSAQNQVKLLRVLSDRRFRQVGGDCEIELGCRIVSATNQHEKMWDRCLFRHDIRARLDQAKITLPPLRESREELPLLFAMEFVRTFRRFVGYNVRCARVTVDAEVLNSVRAPSIAWPLNYRELQIVAQSALLGNLRRLSDRRPRPTAEWLSSLKERLIAEGLHVPFLKLSSKHDQPSVGLLRPESLDVLLMAGPQRPPIWQTITRQAQCEAVAYLVGKKNMNRQDAAKLLGVNAKTLSRRLPKQPTSE